MEIKTTKRILPQRDSVRTMNTNGELIYTMKVKTLYYIWKIPIWKTIKYIDGTHQELLVRI